MATRIRLKRVGGRNDAHFRIVVADGRKRRDGRVIEELGWYRPSGETKLEVNSERAADWLSVGAQPSDTVRSLLQQAGVIEGPVEETAQEAEGETETEAQEAAEAAEAVEAEEAVAEELEGEGEEESEEAS
ncbi:MAG: 30S ribosomal protein S16 [Armatimonadota bacterium]|nr:30S ribosomal protein S16 [Armatimonadota bacterium]